MMVVSHTRCFMVRVDGVTHEIDRAELINVWSVPPGSPTNPDGDTARVVLLCQTEPERTSWQWLFVDPRTIVNTPDGAGVDCMTCLVRGAAVPSRPRNLFSYGRLL